MARSAPAVNGTPTTRRVSFRFIDDSGDKRATSLNLDGATTDAQIEALAEALGDGSSAVLYRVDIENSYRSVPDASLAADAEQNSVWDQISILYQTPQGASERLVLPAPIEGMMLDDTDTPNITAATYTAVRDAGETVLPAAYEPVSARFTERRETNSRVPAQ